MSLPSIENAIKLAARLHKGQKDKAGEPYILHVLSVMVSKRLKTRKQRILAALHDTKEDCDCSDEELADLGYEQDIVAGRDRLSRRPDEDYDTFIERVAGGSVDEILVKLADLDHNADLTRIKDPKPSDLKRTEKYFRAILRLESELARRQAAQQ